MINSKKNIVCECCKTNQIQKYRKNVRYCRNCARFINDFVRSKVAGLPAKVDYLINLLEKNENKKPIDKKTKDAHSKAR